MFNSRNKKSNSTQNAPRTFPQFPKLPPEIRQEIWQLALAGNPTFIHVKRTVDSIAGTNQRSMYCVAVPSGRTIRGSISCVCNESHRMAILFYYKIYSQTTEASLASREPRDLQNPIRPGPFRVRQVCYSFQHTVSFLTISNSYQHDIFYIAPMLTTFTGGFRTGYVAQRSLNKHIHTLALKFTNYRTPSSEQHLSELLSPLKSLKELIFVYDGVRNSLYVDVKQGFRLGDNWVCKKATGPKSYYQRMLALRYEVECIFMLDSLFEDFTRQVDISFKRSVEIELKQ